MTPIAASVGPLFEQIADNTPFANSEIPPSSMERIVASLIWPHQGRANAISIAHLCKCTGRDDRTIKGIVEQLVTAHKIRIGGKRTDPVGYFVIVDAEDLEVAVRAYREQLFSMWRRLRVLLSPHAQRELHGQLVIDAKGEKHE